MWIPVKSDYALRAATVVARAWPDGRVKADEIAAETQVPQRFLENILGELRRGGILTGQRGYYGGYSLTRRPSEIDLAQILTAVASPLVTARVDAEARAPEIIDAVWAEVGESTRRLLEGRTLADLLDSAPA